MLHGKRIDYIGIVIERLKKIIGMEDKKNMENLEEQLLENEDQQEDQQTIEEDDLEIQLAEAKDKYLRLFAEFENFKKRNIKERMALISSASQDTLSSLLPILDDFDRAKKSAEDDANDEVFPEGVNLVYQKLYKTLENKGLNKMDTNGELFDPEIHEAITKIPAPNDEMKGKIMDTIEPGYKLNDKIIRHAKVVVGE